MINSGVQFLSNSDQMLDSRFCPKPESPDWVAILLQYYFTLPPIIQCKYVLDWMRPPALVGGPSQTSLCFFVRH